ncbi:MAG: MarR family transcriptional regulator [Dehalococcoidia bacterium]|nr:MarR family transcriptional regulator [Dehalococcoidia bacterium]
MTTSDERRHLIDDIITLAERDFLSVPRMMGDEWLTLDITMSQFKVLLLLQQEGSMRVSEIAAALGVTQAVVTGVTDRLVHRDLIERVGDPHDRRVVICRLTAEGDQLAQRLSLSGMERGRKLMEVMTVEELQLLKETFEMASRVLKRVKHKLGVEAGNYEPTSTE